MREDSDEMRQLIKRRIVEKGLTEAHVSQVILQRKRTYLNDYLGSKRSPKFMPERDKALLASGLDILPSRLGLTISGNVIVAKGGGFADDAVPYVPGPNFPQLPEGYFPYLVRNDALAQYCRPGIPAGTLVPGVVAIIDGKKKVLSDLNDGDAIIGQLVEREMPQRNLETVFRQFVGPDKLITNRRGDNEIISIDDPENGYFVVLHGVLSYVMLNAPAGLSEPPPVRGNVPLILP